MKTFRKKSNKAITRKNRVSTNLNILEHFQEEITVVFFEILLMVKLFHWKTKNYAAHKASDKLYKQLNDIFDTFIEVLLGKSGVRTDLIYKKSIRLIDLNSAESFKREIDSFKSYLIGLNDNKAMKLMSNTDLYNIRDTILGDLNQFLYLLTFK